MRIATRLGLGFALAGLVGLLGYGLSQRESVPRIEQKDVAPQGIKGDFDVGKAGTPMPSAHDLAGPNGKPRVVNLWASWCAPCRAELPDLDKLQVALGDQATVIIIAEDKDPAKAEAILKDLGISKVTSRVDEKADLMWQVGAVGLPLTLILDKDGKEIARAAGPRDWGAPEVQAEVKDLLAGRPGNRSPR